MLEYGGWFLWFFALPSEQLKTYIQTHNRWKDWLKFDGVLFVLSSLQCLNNHSSKLFERNNYTMAKIKIPYTNTYIDTDTDSDSGIYIYTYIESLFLLFQYLKCASWWFLLHLMVSIHFQHGAKNRLLTSFHAIFVLQAMTTIASESSFY